MTFGMLPLLFPTLYAAAKRKAAMATPEQVSMQMPNYANTSILVSQQQERKAAQSRRGRRKTDVTGGLRDSTATLGGASLFGL